MPPLCGSRGAASACMAGFARRNKNGVLMQANGGGVSSILSLREPTTMPTADEIKTALLLKPHPIEGGYFRETYRSAAEVPGAILPPSYAADAPRSFGTAIYYLLTPDTFSELHTLPTEEVFHFYLGGPVRMWQLFPDGRARQVVLGTDILAGQEPQVVVPAGVMLGWRTRIMTVLLYLGMLSLYHRNVSSNGGPDAVPMITSFYLMFCPAGAAYSLDALRAARKRGTYAEPLIVPWAQRMLQMQLCLIYFQSSAIKCEGALWRNGTTVHYVLFNREFAWFNLEWLAQYPLLINVMSHGAILTQFALAFWLWFRPTRRWAILAGLGLHLGIRPMLNIPGFGEFMTAMYITFLAPDELDAVIRSLDPRVWFARLGLHSSLAALWRSSRPAPRPGWQQLEFPFEVTGQAGAGPAAAS